MPIGTFAIVLLAAFAHAGWNLASKYKRGDTILFVGAYTVGSAILCAPLAVWFAAAGVQPITPALIGASAVSAALHAGYSLALQAGYDRAAFGVVYPVARGTGPLLSMGVAVAVLGERIGWTSAVGGLLVVGGILVVAGDPRKMRGGDARRGVLWGVMTGVAIAAYTLWDAHAVGRLGLAPESYYAGTLLFQCAMLTPGILRRRAGMRTTLRADWRPIILVAVLSPLAYILVLTAMQESPVALVAPLRESSIVIGSLIAWRLFDEHGLGRRVLGAVVVLAGIVVIGL
jgi:drug/metabolite transporter (DMT)-like permease